MLDFDDHSWPLLLGRRVGQFAEIVPQVRRLAERARFPAGGPEFCQEHRARRCRQARAAEPRVREVPHTIELSEDKRAEPMRPRTPHGGGGFHQPRAVRRREASGQFRLVSLERGL